MTEKLSKLRSFEGNSAGLRTVFSSRHSHRELRSSLRESHTHSVHFFGQFFYTVKLHRLTWSAWGPLNSDTLTTLLFSFSFWNDSLQPHRNTNHNSDATWRHTSDIFFVCWRQWNIVDRELKNFAVSFIKVGDSTSFQNWHHHKWSTSKNRFLLVFVVHVVSMTMRSAISWESVSSSCKESDAVSYLECLGVGASMSAQTWYTYVNNMLSK